MNDLNEHLTREADQFVRRGGTELDLAQVLDRAGEIRRGRRLRATLAMAAALLVIAVPTIAIATRDRHVDPPPATHQAKADHALLSLTALHTGAEPRGGYVDSGALHLAGFSYSSKGGAFVAFARFDGGVMVAVRDEGGDVRAHLLDSTKTWPMSGDFVVSANGGAVAFVQPDGTPVVLDKGGSHELPRIPRGSGFDAVAIMADSCPEGVEAVGCSVWVNASGRTPQVWMSTFHREAVRSAARFRSLADWTRLGQDEIAAGISDLHDDLTTCSAVDGASWSTCDHRFIAFSGDGKRLLATGSIGDGLGDSDLAVLDSLDGTPQLNLHTADGAVLTQLVWEDDSHVLATVFEKGRWAVLRVGMDGSREYAVAPVAGDETESPFVLPSA